MVTLFWVLFGVTLGLMIWVAGGVAVYTFIRTCKPFGRRCTKNCQHGTVRGSDCFCWERNTQRTIDVTILAVSWPVLLSLGVVAWVGSLLLRVPIWVGSKLGKSLGALPKLNSSRDLESHQISV